MRKVVLSCLASIISHNQNYSLPNYYSQVSKLITRTVTSSPMASAKQDTKEQLQAAEDGEVEKSECKQAGAAAPAGGKMILKVPKVNTKTYKCKLPINTTTPGLDGHGIRKE